MGLNFTWENMHGHIPQPVYLSMGLPHFCRLSRSHTLASAQSTRPQSSRVCQQPRWPWNGPRGTGTWPHRKIRQGGQGWPHDGRKHWKSEIQSTQALKLQGLALRDSTVIENAHGKPCLFMRCSYSIAACWMCGALLSDPLMAQEVSNLNVDPSLVKKAIWQIR